MNINRLLHHSENSCMNARIYCLNASEWFILSVLNIIFFKLNNFELQLKSARLNIRILIINLKLIIWQLICLILLIFASVIKIYYISKYWKISKHNHNRHLNNAFASIFCQSQWNCQWNVILCSYNRITLQFTLIVQWLDLYTEVQ